MRLTSISLTIWIGLMSATAFASEIKYPQIIRTRYEAVDQKAGGRFVEVTQVTPTVGSITLTYIEVRTVASQTSDYLYLTGNVRFRISGMALKSSNFPPGSGMAP